MSYQPSTCPKHLVKVKFLWWTWEAEESDCCFHFTTRQTPGHGEHVRVPEEIDRCCHCGGERQHYYDHGDR